ncbi:defensin alpha 5-like [Dasypus novemcinctus]|uniref:defensin alpha 5-like n=1 Tax=Dasypus novemcinctus TaxID=9361 RepID=UPI00265E2578|nr:defensin alpha 5-like [Dasypus novemcinctus]
MRTLAVLSAILLLAFLTHAEPLGESADELPAQEQPEAEDQDMAISFVGDERATREAAGPQQRITCYCRTGLCMFRERLVGTCTLSGRRYSFCCT